MSLVDRGYPDIVRDVLTNLTQGVSQEVHTVGDYDVKARPPVVPDIVLARRPVRRVSFLSGVIAAPRSADTRLPYTFTLNDYELVADKPGSKDLTTIRFLPFGKKPAPGTNLIVNYYPRTTDPTPLTDLNVGSVARTLLEAVSKELSVLYAQLNLAYDNAYLERATGTSLDRVVGLLGYGRFRAGRPAGTVTFRRRAASPGNITIPAGTPVTDAADKIRYETVESHDMLAGESTAEVRVRGAADSTPVAEAGTLTVIQRALAGVDGVLNDRPTSRATADESDEELRARAGAALIAVSKGTVEALTHGLLQLPQVRDVKIEEMPNGVPGEIRVAVSLTAPPAAGDRLPPEVSARIEELRPAGIRVLASSAATTSLSIAVRLVLAGSSLPAPEVAAVHDGVRRALTDAIQKLGVGAKVRVQPLVARILADQRVADAELVMGIAGGTPGAAGADLTPPAGASVEISRPEDISFAADTFNEAPPAGQKIPVEVRVSLALAPLAGVSAAEAKSAVQAKLAQFFAALRAGASIDAAALLTAMRDDARYAVDPLKLIATLTADTQFIQIAQGGAAFTVAAEHTFSIASVEVTP